MNTHPVARSLSALLAPSRLALVLAIAASTASAVAHARPTCSLIYPDIQCPPEFGGEGSILLDPKTAPATVGGITRESSNTFGPVSDVGQLVSGGLANVLRQIGGGSVIDGRGGNEVTPKGMTSCLGTTFALGQDTGTFGPPHATQRTERTDHDLCAEATSRGSHVDNLRWSYVHTGYDYSVGDARACAVVGCPNPAAGLEGQLKRLAIKRIHRPLFASEQSSFGPGVFSQYDVSFALSPAFHASPAEVYFYDPETDAAGIWFTETTFGSGIYADTETNSQKSIELFTSSGARAASVLDAVTGVVTAHTGEKWNFEVIEIYGTRYGRLTKKLDRSGNAETVSYVFARTASDTTLGNDRNKLWQISNIKDPYGATATVSSYTNVGGRWSISNISLPNSVTLAYQYDPGAAGGSMMLTGVNYSDGTFSSFSASIDWNLLELDLHIDDAAAGPDQRHHVFVTLSDWNGWFQQPNVTRRVTNENGETVYKNWEDRTTAGVSYVFDAPGRLTRFKKVDGGTGYPTEVAYATATAIPTLPPTSFTFEVAETYQADAFGTLTSRTRSDGFVKSFVRDAAKAIAQIATPGSVTKSATGMNAMRQPGTITDLMGKAHAFIYNSAGNITKATIAVGTAVQAVWNSDYTSRGQPLNVTNGNGFVTTYGYDAKGNLTSVTEPADVAGGTTSIRRYGYDSASGRITSYTDASGHITSYAYDTRGRLKTITHPDGTTETFLYNFNGLVSERVDRRATRTLYNYDTTNRLLFVQEAFGTTEEQGTSLRYATGSHLTSVENVGGKTETSYVYDRRNRLTLTSVPVRTGVNVQKSISWDVHDRKLFDTDSQGFKAYYVYDNKDRVSRTVRELGKLPTTFTPAQLPPLARDAAENPRWAIKDFQYDNAGHANRVTDELNTVTTTTYDEQGRRTQTVAGLGAGTSVQATTKYSYDADGNLTKTIRPRTFTAEGNNTDTFREEMTYTRRDLVLTVTEAKGRPEAVVARTLTYTPTRKLFTEIDGNGKTQTHKYDANDRPSELVDADGFSTKKTYDGNGNVLTIVDGNIHTTTFEYDRRDRMKKKTNAALEVETMTYDEDLTDTAGISGAGVASGLGFIAGVAQGFALVNTNAEGGVSVIIQDALGRDVRSGPFNPPLSNLTTVTHEFGSFTATTPGTHTLVVTAVADGNGFKVQSAKDSNGVSRRIVDQENKVTTVSVNAAGKSLKLRKPTGAGADWVYDARNRISSVTDVRGSKNSYTYDVEDNLTKTVNPLLKARTSTFDARNQRIKDVNELLKETNLLYDGARRLTKLTDTEGRITQYQFNNRGLLMKQTYSDSVAVNFTYDNAGHLKTKTNQLNQVLTLNYDAADRLMSRVYPDGLNDTFLYDKASRLKEAKSARYGNNLVKRTYTTLGQLKTEAVTVGSVTGTTTYTYNLAGQVSFVTYPNSATAAAVVGRTYNGRGELSGATLDSTTVATYIRDDGGRPTSATFANGTAETRVFRTDDLLESVLLKKGTTTLASFSYGYDANKRKTSETNALTGTETQGFGYDDVDRLTTWNRGGTVETQGWTLTNEGDWSLNVRNGANESRAHDAAHQISSITKTSTINVVSDARGRITTDDQARTFTWDFDDQLKSTTASGTTTAYTYDALGRRISKVVGGVTTVFLNEGERDDARPLAEFDSGAFARLYVYGGGQRDQVILMKAGTNRYFFTQNAHYSVHMVTNDAGAVAEKYRYDAYGQRTVMNASGTVLSTTAIANRLGFTGRYHDETGLTHFRTRYYQPRYGRFITRDPDFVDGSNLYGAYYVPNGMDPSGKNFITDGLGTAYHAVKDNVVDPITGPIVDFAQESAKKLDQARQLVWDEAKAGAEWAWDKTVQGAKYMVFDFKNTKVGSWLISTGVQIAVKYGLTMALHAMGVPPPAAEYIGAFVGGALASMVQSYLQGKYDLPNWKERMKIDIFVGGFFGIVNQGCMDLAETEVAFTPSTYAVIKGMEVYVKTCLTEYDQCGSWGAQRSNQYPGPG